MKDYYDVLQVSPDAEQEVVEAAYKRLARKYHPDVNRDATAADRMRELNEAYEVLGDSHRRAEYDAALGRAWARAEARRRQGDRVPPPPPPPPPPRPPPPPPPPRRQADQPAGEKRASSERSAAGLSALPPFVLLSAVTAAVLALVLPLIVVGSALLTKENGETAAPKVPATQSVQPAPAAGQPSPGPLVHASADDDPSWGPSDAPVTIIEFGDFQ